MTYTPSEGWQIEMPVFPLPGEGVLFRGCIAVENTGTKMKLNITKEELK
jgi:hypothetical protein